MKISSFLLLLLAPSVSAETMVNSGTIDLETCEKAVSYFDIQLRFMGEGEIDPRYTEAFETAAERWSKIIVGDVSDVAGMTNDWFEGQFPGRSYNGPVDDIVIGYDIQDTIDGPGRILGGAGPIFVRRDGLGRPLQTISGIMFFDGSDLDTMSTTDVKIIILHEMGHVLGLVGTTNTRCTQACAADNPDVQSAYSCPQAIAEYESIAEGAPLKLENRGGVGTACGHFEEDSFRTDDSSEVMTGFFEPNMFQPISSVTVAALQDIGYFVDFCGADIWPADDETIHRFEVMRQEAEMEIMSVAEEEMEEMDDTSDMGSTVSVMIRIPPQWGIDTETGEMTPFALMNTSMPLDPLSLVSTDGMDSGEMDSDEMGSDEIGSDEMDTTMMPTEGTSSSSASGSFTLTGGNLSVAIVAAMSTVSLLFSY